MILNIYIMRLYTKVRRFITINRLRSKYSLTIGRNCRVNKDFKCGYNCIIGENAQIGRNVVINNNVTISGSASIRNISINDNSHIEGGVKVLGYGKGKITIGKETYIGINNVLDWSDNITIGNYVHIAGPSTALWTHSSSKQAIAGLPLNDKNPEYRPTAPITIENNVYIGGNCTIYPGITISHHSIVAPNSVVNKNVEPFTLVGGVPAKFLKKIDVPTKE